MITNKGSWGFLQGILHGDHEKVLEILFFLKLYSYFFHPLVIIENTKKTILFTYCFYVVSGSIIPYSKEFNGCEP